MTTAPPPLPKVKLTRVWKRLIIVALTVIVLVVVGVVTIAVIIWANRQDTPERYAELASVIAKPTYRAGEQPQRQSEAELRVFIDRRQQIDGRYVWRCRDMASVAEEDLKTMNDLQVFARDEPGLAGLLGHSALTIVGVAQHNPDLIKSEGDPAISEAEKWERFVRTYREFPVRLSATRIKLAEFAPRFGGAVVAKSFVTVNFRPKRTGLISLFTSARPDTLFIRNDSGKPLHDCTILIRLQGSGGDTFTNVLFVSDWADGETRCADFSSDFPADSVDDVANVNVSIWSREQSSPMMSIKAADFIH